MNVKDSYPILGWLFKGFNLLAGLADLVPIGAMEDPNRRHHLIKANLEAEKNFFWRQVGKLLQFEIQTGHSGATECFFGASFSFFLSSSSCFANISRGGAEGLATACDTP